MINLSKYKDANITILDEPILVNRDEWIYSHSDCDSIYLDSDSDECIYILAYANVKQGNPIITKIKKENKSDVKLLAGLDSCMLNFAGGALL